MPDDVYHLLYEDEHTPNTYDSPVDTDYIDDVYMDADLSEYGFYSVTELIDALDDIVDSGYTVDTSSSTKNSEEVIKKMAKSINSIFGIPYQFSKIVDRPMDYYSDREVVSASGVKAKKKKGTTEVGMKYSQKILSVIPVLFLSPGEPKFMDDYGKDARKNFIQNILLDTDGDNNIGDGKYYSFASKFTEYEKYVNVCFKALAKYMNIEDMEIPLPGRAKPVKLSNLTLSDMLSDSFTKFFGAQTVVPFYVDAETSISENFSNGTTESMISQAANQFSSKARELRFLMGHSSKKNVSNVLADMTTAAAEGVAELAGELADGLFQGNNFISRVAGELTTVVSGGKIVFPEIWSESSYSRSYNITLKLRSPDPDPVSIFLNIYVPIILLVCMAAPRQLNNSANSIESPFIVRATYKSIFCCDMGIISSLDIRKGGEALWNVMGMPTSADVDIQIHDMYSSMAISKNQGIINNTALLDYLAVMAGADLNEFEATRTLRLAMSIYAHKPKEFVLNKFNGIKEGLNSAAAGFLSNFADVRYLQ